MRAFILVLLVGGCLVAQGARDLGVEMTAPPLPDQRARWAVVIGVSSYKYAPPAAQLKYAHRDAEEFARFLRSPQGGGLAGSHVRLLTEQNATTGAIRGALGNWLPAVAGPNDVVYLFLAGHAVRGEQNEGYFVAHDADPQNLHATGISFAEINAAIGGRLRASTVVLIADACHAGAIGWAADPAKPSDLQGALEAIGAPDRNVLKLMASRSREQSFEDARWGGGHGVFTFALLNGLGGAAERTADGVIRAGELLDYVSQVVPEQTAARQNPRVAGSFEGSLPLAVLAERRAVAAFEPATLRVRGAAGTLVYVDNRFHGAVRAAGDLVIEGLRPGTRRLAVDEPGGGSYEHELALAAGVNSLDLETAPELALARLERVIASGNLDAAWERFRGQAWTEAQRPAAAARMARALEESGQACVADYVQSNTVGLKAGMLQRAASAFRLLETLRPGEPLIRARALFCQARAEIAVGKLAEAEENLRRSLQIDANFACSYNALGVVRQRQNRLAEARAAFDRARQLTPNWALPPLQIAQMLISAGEMARALPYLEEAARLFPKATGIQWSLARLNRVLRRPEAFLAAARATLAADPNYAPIYSELGLFHEANGSMAEAAEAYNAYLTLAPNLVDSNQVRERMQRLRKPVPSLRRP